MAKITIKNLQKKVPINPARIRKSVAKVLASEAEGKACDITVCIVNDKEIRRLNAQFHGRDATTDVLAFDLGFPGKRDELCADIAVCADTALRNSRMFGTTVGEELELYAVHGALHLLGYDDRNAPLRALMRSKECQFIKPKR